MEELRADKAAAAAAKKGAAAAAAQSRRMETDFRLRAKEEKRVARLLKQQASAVDKANKQADAAAVRADAEQQRAQVREARDAARQAAAEAREQRETDQLMRFVPPSTFKGFTSSPEQLEMHLHHVSLEIVAAAPELSPGLVPWLASPPSRDDNNWPPLRLAFLKSLAAKLGDAYAASVWCVHRMSGEPKIKRFVMCTSVFS
jgi:multidrug efflux pump subunit AcrA (membrane-fusion protein)